MTTFLKNLSMRIMATICTVLLFTTSSSAQLSPARLVLPAQPHSFSFHWRGDSLHGRWEPHTVLLIPVKFSHCPQKFYMQFDLGSPSSMFYRPAMETIRARYPKSVPEENAGHFVNYTFHAGTIPVEAKEIAVKEFGSGSINWQDSTAVNIIGTIGTDFIDGRFLLINYRDGIITTGENVAPELLPGIQMTDFMYAGGRILFPAFIRGKKQLLYFDTGSSAFCLMTDKPTSESLAVPGSTPVGFKVNSWGKPLSAYTLPTNDSITIGSAILPLHESTYVEGASSSMVSQMMKMGISGLTGNKLFVNSVLLLDVKNKKFGIK